MGRALQAVSPGLISTILQCIQKTDIPLSNQKAAIQAFRLMDVNDEVHLIDEDNTPVLYMICDIFAMFMEEFIHNIIMIYCSPTLCSPTRIHSWTHSVLLMPYSSWTDFFFFSKRHLPLRGWLALNFLNLNEKTTEVIVF